MQPGRQRAIDAPLFAPRVAAHHGVACPAEEASPAEHDGAVPTRSDRSTSTSGRKPPGPRPFASRQVVRIHRPCRPPEDEEPRRASGIQRAPFIRSLAWGVHDLDAQRFERRARCRRLRQQCGSPCEGQSRSWWWSLVDAFLGGETKVGTPGSGRSCSRLFRATLRRREPVGKQLDRKPTPSGWQALREPTDRHLRRYDSRRNAPPIINQARTRAARCLISCVRETHPRRPIPPTRWCAGGVPKRRVVGTHRANVP